MEKQKRMECLLCVLKILDIFSKISLLELIWENNGKWPKLKVNGRLKSIILSFRSGGVPKKD